MIFFFAASRLIHFSLCMIELINFRFGLRESKGLRGSNQAHKKEENLRFGCCSRGLQKPVERTMN